jgi:hypothetical protein
MTIQNIIVQDTTIPNELILDKEPCSLWIRPGFGRIFFTDEKGQLYNSNNIANPISFKDWSFVADIADDLYMRAQSEAMVNAMIPLFTALRNQIVESLTTQNTLPALASNYKAANGTDLMSHLYLAFIKATVNIDPNVKEWRYRKFTNIDFQFPYLDAIKAMYPELFTPLDASFVSVWTTCRKPLAIQYIDMLIERLEVFQPAKNILDNNLITEDRTVSVNFINTFFDLIITKLSSNL